jgi:hypothetical protein
MEFRLIKTTVFASFISMAGVMLTPGTLRAADTVVYAIRAGTQALGTLDLNTGVYTQISPHAINDYELGVYGGVLYGASPQCDCLFQLDTSTGVPTFAPTLFNQNNNGFGAQNGFGSTTDGLFIMGAAFGGINNLYSVNPTTGAPTLIGSTGIIAGGGTSYLSASNDSKKLYWEFQNNCTDILYGINTSTGAATLIGSAPACFPSTTGNPFSMVFTGGTLWANFWSVGLGTIDTSTGAQTLVSTSAFPAFFGLAPFPLGGGSVTSALPQLAFGGGWYTALYFSNTTGAVVTVKVSFIGNDGSALSVPLTGIGSVTSQTLNINPGATVILEAPNTGNLVQGWAEAALPAGVDGYAVFRQSVAGRADQEAVVPLTPEDSLAANFSYDDTNFTTTLSFLNPSNQQATATITVYASDGTQLGSTQVVLAARSKQAAILRNLLPAVVGNRGRVALSVTSGAVSVLGIRFEGSAFTSIPVTHASQLPVSSTLFVVPQVAFGGGWYTAFYFSNTTASPISFPVNFMDSGGAPLSVPLAGIGSVTGQTVRLNPGATVVLEAPNNGSLVQGWAETTLPPGVIGYAIFRQSVVGRADQEAVVPLTIESSMGADFSYDDTNFNTSIAFLNPSNQQATLTITIYAAGGTQLGSAQVVLAPRSKQSKVLHDLVPNMAGNRGWASFSVPNGDISVLGLRFGGEAFTTIPVTPR